MKRCPQCKKEFDDAERLCSDDGVELVSLATGLSSDLLINRTLDGKYRLERRIGRGGMGAVYLAHHTKINKQLAVKVLSQEMMEDASAAERLEREANAIARIKHPNAVPVTDFGQTEDGIVYLVMEYIDGPTLRRLLDRERRLTPERAVKIARQICAAIAAAHRANIIHRDLKPDNVMIEMIDGQEVARVLDFGIAKWRDNSGGRITNTNNVLGTPHYMSPEQCNGGDLTEGSDIYALGVMLYEMLSGNVPFNAPTAPAIIVQHVTKEPKPLLEACPDVPHPLAHVVMRALEKQPARRQESATELSKQLDAALEISLTSDLIQPANNAPNQWQVIFQGLLENSDAGRQRLFKGLQRSYKIPSARVEELINGAPCIVKKNVPQDEAQRVAERLRSYGADVIVKPVSESTSSQLAELPADGSRNAAGNLKPTAAVAHKPSAPLAAAPQTGPLNQEAAEKNAGGNVALAPPTLTAPTDLSDEFELSIKPDAPASPSSRLEASPSGRLEDRSLGGNSPTIQVNVAAPDNWSIDINGAINENLSDSEIEAGIRAGRICAPHRARKGGAEWQEIGNIPQFRNLFKESTAPLPLGQIKPAPLGASKSAPLGQIKVDAQKKDNQPPANHFFARAAKLCGAIFFLYIAISFALQYSQQRLLEEDLRTILYDPKTTVITLRASARAAVKQRGLDLPDENIHIIVNPPERNVSIRVDYNRTILHIPLHYQAKKERGDFDLTIEQLAQAPDGQLDIVGIPLTDIERYRREQSAKRLAEISNYQGEPETLKTRAELQAELAECERKNAQLAAPNDDRPNAPQTVKVKDKEYDKNSLKARIAELKLKIGELDRLLGEQRAKKRQEIEQQAGKSSK